MSDDEKPIKYPSGPPDGVNDSRWIDPTDEALPPQAGGEVQGQTGLRRMTYDEELALRAASDYYEYEDAHGLRLNNMDKLQSFILNAMASSLSARGGREEEDSLNK